MAQEDLVLISTLRRCQGLLVGILGIILPCETLTSAEIEHDLYSTSCATYQVARAGRTSGLSKLPLTNGSVDVTLDLVRALWLVLSHLSTLYSLTSYTLLST